MSKSLNPVSERIELLNNYTDHEKIAIECGDGSFVIGIEEMQDYLRSVSSFIFWPFIDLIIFFREMRRSSSSLLKTESRRKSTSSSFTIFRLKATDEITTSHSEEHSSSVCGVKT